VESLTATGNFTVQGVTDVKSLTATGNLTVQGETEVESLTATGNLTVQGETEVESLTANGSLTAFQPISLVDPTEPNKFSLEYNKNPFGTEQLIIKYVNGEHIQEYITLSNTVSGLVQLQTPAITENTLTCN